MFFPLFYFVFIAIRKNQEKEEQRKIEESIFLKKLKEKETCSIEPLIDESPFYILSNQKLEKTDGEFFF